MKKAIRNPWVVLIAVMLPAIALWAQQQPPAASTAPTPPLKIEGEVTSGLKTADTCMPSFTLKTKEGKEYTIHLGTLKDPDEKVFAPKIGETIAVTGTPCCQMGGQLGGMMGGQMAGMMSGPMGGMSGEKSMIHPTAITVAGKTFQAPAGEAMGGMMMGSGGMGQGMAMGSGGMGQGMMMEQGTAGQGAQKEPMPGMMMGPGMTGGGTMASGTMGSGAMACCAGMGTGSACQSCMGKEAPQTAPAAPSEHSGQE
jgi:hypothetical protein